MKRTFQLILNSYKSDFFKNTSTLVTGTVIAQSIPILIQPILRRYYSPDIFGAYAVYLSLIGILFVISSFRYEMAIILPKKDKTAANVLILSQVLNLFFNLVLFVFILCFKEKILKFLNLPLKFQVFILLVPLGTFLYNFYQSVHYWLIRKKAFFIASVNKMVRRGTEGSVQIGSKFFNFQPGLVIGDIAGHVANGISGIIQCYKTRFPLKNISITKLKYVSVRYSDFPKYNVISSFWGAFSFLIPAIFINKFFNSEYAGYYDLSKLVLSIPLALIAGSIANVLLQRFSEKKQKKISIKRDFLTVLSIVTVIAVFEIIVISLFSTELFNFFFGKQWEMSGEISKLLVWSYALNFIIFSFSSIFISLEKIKILSLWQLFHFLSILLLLFFKDLSFLSFIKIYVIIEIICYTSYFLLLTFVIRRYEKTILV